MRQYVFIYTLYVYMTHDGGCVKILLPFIYIHTDPVIPGMIEKNASEVN